MIYEIKKVGVLVAIISGIMSSIYVSKQEGHPWFWWVLAWLWFPLCTGTFLLGVTLYERVLMRRDLQRRLQRHKEKQERKQQKQKPLP